MKLNWNFQKGGGGLRKTPFHGGDMDIYPGIAMYRYVRDITQSGVQYHTCTCLISSSFTTATTTVGLLTCNRVSTGWSFFKLLGIKVPKNQSLIHLTKHGQKCTMEQNHPLCFLCLLL